MHCRRMEPSRLRSTYRHRHGGRDRRQPLPVLGRIHLRHARSILPSLAAVAAAAFLLLVLSCCCCACDALVLLGRCCCHDSNACCSMYFCYICMYIYIYIYIHIYIYISMYVYMLILASLHSTVYAYIRQCLAVIQISLYVAIPLICLLFVCCLLSRT